jgi:hypothetical protein
MRILLRSAQLVLEFFIVFVAHPIQYITKLVFRVLHASVRECRHACMQVRARIHTCDNTICSSMSASLQSNTALSVRCLMFDSSDLCTIPAGSGARPGGGIANDAERCKSLGSIRNGEFACGVCEINCDPIVEPPAASPTCDKIDCTHDSGDLCAVDARCALKASIGTAPAEANKGNGACGWFLRDALDAAEGVGRDEAEAVGCDG